MIRIFEKAYGCLMMCDASTNIPNTTSYVQVIVSVTVSVLP